MFFAPAIRRDASLSPLGSDRGFERFMDDMLTGFEGFGIEEDDKSWTLSLDVPGVPKEQLDVSVSGNRVVVQTAGDAKRQYKLAYELSGDVDTDATEAHLADGVLTLRLGKAETKSRRQITIA